MKINRMLKFFISLISFLFINITLGNVSLKNDTIEKFGIRVGADIHKIIRSASNNDYTGFSFDADIRLKESIYISSEIGNEEKQINNSYINSTAKGNYLKFGAKFKLNKKDIGTQNITYSGLNIGFSGFNQTINSYTIYNTNSSTWGESIINEPINLNDLNALWFEILFGLKTEIINNLFLGFEIQLKNIISQKNSKKLLIFTFLVLTELTIALVLVLVSATLFHILFL